MSDLSFGAVQAADETHVNQDNDARTIAAKGISGRTSMRVTPFGKEVTVNNQWCICSRMEMEIH